ncbi:hypothetical protein F4778DRAFT_782872 [Xylariomycetidae sp. FL2044]|nr:hypothetical protein F4778DRAFT_782872 [Xylariomycetidae sp. FL2044]
MCQISGGIAYDLNGKDWQTGSDMLPQPAVVRASTSMVTRRAFHATRARLSSPYHYPEGPYSNLPFNTKTRFFAVRYWLYCITGFFTPFGIAVWQTRKPKA